MNIQNAGKNINIQISNYIQIQIEKVVLKH